MTALNSESNGSPLQLLVRRFSKFKKFNFFFFGGGGGGAYLCKLLGGHGPPCPPYSYGPGTWIIFPYQLLPLLLMEHFDSLPIQFRHNEHIHERGLVQNFYLDKMTAIIIIHL